MDVETGEIKHIKVSGINITDGVEKGAMVILRAKLKEVIEKEEGSKLLSNLLKERNIQIMVVYKRNEGISDEEVKKTILFDKNITVKNVRDTISCLRRYDVLPLIGSGLIVDVDKKIKYVITSGVNFFPRTPQVIDALKELGISVFIASGDRLEKEEMPLYLSAVPSENIFGMQKPEDKKDLVKNLKEKYEKVMMVGDDRNDYLAMKEADIAVLSQQIEGERTREIFEVTDFTIKDIMEVKGIVEKLIR